MPESCVDEAVQLRLCVRRAYVRQDINQDGGIDAVDVQLVINAALGL